MKLTKYEVTKKLILTTRSIALKSLKRHWILRNARVEKIYKHKKYEKSRFKKLNVFSP